MNSPEHHSVNEKRPIGKATHFGLSFLAVLIGVPISFFATFIGGILLISLIFAAFMSDQTSPPSIPLHYEYKYGKQLSTNRLVSIPIYGPIVSQSSASDPLMSIFGGQFTDGEKVKEQLIELAHNDAVKGIILEIDSPGGQINASKAIGDGVSYVRGKQKPIIAHINGLGTSGAYMAAVGTEYILAEQGSLAANIGVILGDLPYFRDINSIAGVTSNTSIPVRTFSAGKSKDLGNPFREMTAEEINFLNDSLGREYNSFVDYVSKQRDISAETIKDQIGALPYDSQRALELKLIDAINNKEEAYLELSKRARLPHDDFVVEQVKPNSGFFGGFFGAALSRFGIQASQPAVDHEARGRFCAQFTRSPLLLYNSTKLYCD
jgi:protease-4